MKFSKRKKAKIRKRNQRRINRYCSDMIGTSIFCSDDEYTVIDQAKIKGVIYLITQNESGEYAFFKIVSVYMFVKLSPKRILQNKKAFSNHTYWKEHCTIEIMDDGKIYSVKRGSIFGPYDEDCYEENYVIYVVGDIY